MIAADRRVRMALCVAVAMCAARPHAQDPDAPLLEIARDHVNIAESTREESQLWGRLGGSAAERESAHLLSRQLGNAEVEPVEFFGYRPVTWSLSLDGTALASAMPAPFDARMPDVPPTRVVHVRNDDDWPRAKGAWAFYESKTEGSAARTDVRAQNLFQRAVDAGAVGFVFSLPTPPGVWRSVVPVDKPFALPDEKYPDHVRPIPCFSVDAGDGARLRAGAGSDSALSVKIEYHPSMQRKGLNVVQWLKGDGDTAVMIACHLDSFFSGANDDASGIAVMVGMYRELRKLDMSSRRVNFWFVGLSSHHDEGNGMRAFVRASPERMDGIKAAILLEHLDMHPGKDLPRDASAAPLNDQRAAFTGDNGWPEIEEALPRLVKLTGLMTVPPGITRACIADLFVICDRVQPFCLMAAPPYYHTDHDTMDKLTEAGLQRAVDFHMHLLAEAGYIAND